MSYKYDTDEIERKLESEYKRYYIQEFTKFLLIFILFVGIYTLVLYLVNKNIDFNFFISKSIIIVYVLIPTIYTQFYPPLKNLKINLKYLYMAILHKITEFKDEFMKFQEKTIKFQEWITCLQDYYL